MGNLPGIICFLCCASTAQHSTAQSTRTSSKPSTRRSKRNNASKQTELARASMSSSIYTAPCVLKTNEEIEVCPAYKIQTYANVHKQLLKLVCDVASRKLLFLSVLSISSVHAAACTGLFSWTMELLAFARRQFSLCTQNHGYPLHSFAFRSLLRVRVRVRVRFNYSV